MSKSIQDLFAEYVNASSVSGMVPSWSNVSDQDYDELKQKALSSLQGNIDSFAFWFEYGTDKESSQVDGLDQDDLDQMFESGEIDQDEYDEKTLICQMFENEGSFHDHGLCFDFVEADEKSDGFFRYQISWGGPSTEFRFYRDGSVEFVFLDWFVGIGFDVSYIDEIKQLAAWFNDCGSMPWDEKQEEEISSEYYRLINGYDEEEEE